ncbi:MAG: hypothetical protein FJ247_02095 [Nitrospira sp.]|nr:hypothetical protein [Nitrospira sp.]
MAAKDLIESWITRLDDDRLRIGDQGQDVPITAAEGRHVRTIGGLHLYEFRLPAGVALRVDLPVSIIPSDEGEPTEGIILHQFGNFIFLQTLDSLGTPIPSVTLVPDQAGLLDTIIGRLKDMITRADAYNLGPAERLASLLQAQDDSRNEVTSESSVLRFVWLDELSQRRYRLAGMAMELIRANKRILLLSPDHHESDEIVGILARRMKAGGLNYNTWISRYELPLTPHSRDISLQELGFESQTHQFYAKAQAEKASLRGKYERFRELAPLLAAKANKQKDLDEVRLLEWRLVSQMRDLQVKLAEVTTTLSEYAGLSLFQRLSMQAVGRNVDSLKQYQSIYQQQIDALNQELDVAKARIQELVPEAAVPKDLRPEFDDLKEHIVKLGGTKKIRELLAAEEDPNRQAFIQNRRLVAATPTRVASDPLFSRVRFDILIADEAPRIAAALLVAAAGLARERIIVSGDLREIATASQWTLGDKVGRSIPSTAPSTLA